MSGHRPIRLGDRQIAPFAPGAAMPGMLFRILRRRTAGCGELRLAVAVLEDAVHCLERTRGARDFFNRLLRWEVEQWFASRDRGPLFSFESICSLLDLEADAIRGQLGGGAGRPPGPLPASAFFRKRLRGSVRPARLIEDPAWVMAARRILAAEALPGVQPSLDIRRRLPLG